MKQQFRKFITLALIISMIWNPTFFNARANAAESNNSTVQSGNPQLDAETFYLLDAAARLEKAGPNSFPGKIRDRWHFNDQYVLASEKGVREPRRFELGSIGMPVISGGVFEEDVKVEITPGQFALTFYAKGQFVAAQVFPGFDIVSIARDEDFIILADKRGKIFAIDAGYARKMIFQSPIQVIEIHNVKRSLTSFDRTYILKSGIANLEIEPGAIVPLDVNKDSPLIMGNIALINEIGGSRKIAALLSRVAIGEIVAMEEKVLAAEIFSVTSPVEAQAQADAIERVETAAKQRAKALELAEHKSDLELSLPEASVLAKLGAEDRVLLGNRVAYNASISSQLRHRTSELGNTEDYNDLLRLAQNRIESNREEIEKYRQGLTWIKSSWHRFLTTVKKPTRDSKLEEENKSLESQILEGDLSPSRVTLLQAAAQQENKKLLLAQKQEREVLTSKFKARQILLIKALIGGAAIYGFASSAWGIHLLHEFLAMPIFDVFRNEVYRWTLLKSVFWQSLLVPAVNIVGILSLWFVAKKGWNAGQAIGSYTLKMCAVIVLSPFHRLAQLFNQPLIMKAMQRGTANPFIKVAGYEDVYPYQFNRPIWWNQKEGEDPSWNREVQAKVLARKAEALDIIALRQATAKKLALTLAMTVVAHKVQLDPALLQVITEQGPMSSEALRAFAESNLSGKIVAAAREMELQLLTIDSFNSIKDIKDMTPQMRVEAFQITLTVLDQIEKAGLLKKFQMSSKHTLRRGLNWFSRYIGSWGVKENAQMKFGHIDADLGANNLRQFNLDYGVSVAIMATMGAHADFNDPRMLMGVANAPFSTNPIVVSEQLEQVWIYLGTAFAKTLVTFNLSPPPSAQGHYKPNESIVLTGIDKSEPFMYGMISWLKDVANLRKSKLFDYPFKTFKVDIQLIWMRMVGFIVSKAVFLGFSVSSSLQRFLSINQLLGFWGVNAFWTPVTRGVQLRTARLEGNKETLDEARSSLAQHLRLAEYPEAALAIQELGALYQRSSVTYLKSKLGLSDSETLPRELEAQLAEINKFIEAPTIEYSDQILEKIKKVAPQIIEYTRTNPPFSTAENKKVEYAWIGAGTLGSTIMSTYLTGISTSKDFLAQAIDFLPLILSLYGGAWIIKKGTDYYDKWKSKKESAVNSERATAQAEQRAACLYNLERVFRR